MAQEISLVISVGSFGLVVGFLAPPAKSASPALPVAKLPPGQTPAELERQPSTPELGGLSPMGYANRDDDQSAAGNASNRHSTIPLVARSAANQAIGASQAR